MYWLAAARKGGGVQKALAGRRGDGETGELGAHKGENPIDGGKSVQAGVGDRLPVDNLDKARGVVLVLPVVAPLALEFVPTHAGIFVTGPSLITCT